MKFLVNLYTASCVFVAGLFLVLNLPLELLPFSDGVNITIVGLALAGFAAYFIYYFYRREGFELGWFLAKRSGFWILAVGILGIMITVCGIAITVAPQHFTPAFEQAALPFGVVIVSMFWLALIYIFGYLTIGMTARVVAGLRIKRTIDAAINGIVMLVCLGLATLFFSLYIDVLNDLLMRISIEKQWTAIWIFIGCLIVAGAIYGVLKQPSYHLNDEPDDDGLQGT